MEKDNKRALLKLYSRAEQQQNSELTGRLQDSRGVRGGGENSASQSIFSATVLSCSMAITHCCLLSPQVYSSPGLLPQPDSYGVRKALRITHGTAGTTLSQSMEMSNWHRFGRVADWTWRPLWKKKNFSTSAAGDRVLEGIMPCY